MEVEGLWKVQKYDGAWKYLKESSSVFEKQFNRYLEEAVKLTGSNALELNYSCVGNEGVICYEGYCRFPGKVVLSFVTKPVNNEYKELKEVTFSLDYNHNLEVNEIYGRLEANHGYNFRNTVGGMVNTSYRRHVYNKDGIELYSRTFSDEITIPTEEPKVVSDKPFIGTFKTINDRFHSTIKIVCNPFTNKSYVLAGNNPQFVEQSRSMDNLGLVKEVTSSSFDNIGEFSNKKVEYYLNTFTNGNQNFDPYLIRINSGLPIAYVDKNEIAVNYQNIGVTVDNYGEIAKRRFVSSACERMKTLEEERNKVGWGEYDRYEAISQLIGKYGNLSRMYPQYLNEEIEKEGTTK